MDRGTDRAETNRHDPSHCTSAVERPRRTPHRAPPLAAKSLRRFWTERGCLPLPVKLTRRWRLGPPLIAVRASSCSRAVSLFRRPRTATTTEPRSRRARRMQPRRSRHCVAWRYSPPTGAAGPDTDRRFLVGGSINAPDGTGTDRPRVVLGPQPGIPARPRSLPQGPGDERGRSTAATDTDC